MTAKPIKLPGADHPIAVAPNPARWSQIATVRAANQAIRTWIAGDPRLT